MKAMSENKKIHCGHCGVTYYSAWGSSRVNCYSPVERNDKTVGLVFGAICPECNAPTLQYGRSNYVGTSTAYNTDEIEEIESSRVTIYPDNSDYTLEIVITIIIELQSARKEKNEGAGFTEEEKREYRNDPSVVKAAKDWVAAATASMAGSSASQVIAGLISAGVS